MGEDKWIHRGARMRCASCMWFVIKALASGEPSAVGRCRKHAPAMTGYPVVDVGDWCGDHKVDENKWGV